MTQQTVTFGSAQYNSWTAEAAGTDIVSNWTVSASVTTTEAPATGAIGTTGTGGDVSLDGRPVNMSSLKIYWWADASPTTSTVDFQIATATSGAGGYQSGATNATGASTTLTPNYLSARATTVYYGFQKNDTGNVRFNTATVAGATIYNNGVESTSWAGRRIYAQIVVQSVPNAPTALTGSTVNATAVSLSWTAPTDGGTTAGVNGYRIYQRLANATANTAADWSVVVDDTGSTVTSRTITGLNPAVSYVYMVAALNSATDLMLAADTANASSPVTSYFDLQAHSGSRSAVSAAVNTAGGVYGVGGTWLGSPNVKVFNGTAWVDGFRYVKNATAWTLWGQQ
jgi:hypothetical protein